MHTHEHTHAGKHIYQHVRTQLCTHSLDKQRKNIHKEKIIKRKIILCHEKNSVPTKITCLHPDKDGKLT